MIQIDCINKSDDGYYHPKNEEEITCLVKKAYNEGLQVRCRGAAHSVAWSIYTDPGKDDQPIRNKVSVQKPPEGPNINIMLDRFTNLQWINEEKGIVEAEAGIHLGLDPDDPTGTSTLKNSLLFQAFEKGWTLNDLGGITHQTISGFLMTGSAGGSLTYDLSENILAFRVIDGLGDVKWIEKDNEIFNAMALSFGLLGIITKVRFQLTRNFYIYGQEFTTPTAIDDCPIDLFGPGQGKKPGLAEYLKRTPYTRILWWPQKGANRIVIWEAVRGDTLPAFDPAPYKEFGDIPFFTKLEQLGAAILFTLLGNKGFFKIWGKLYKDFKRFRILIKKLWQKKLGKKLGKFLGKFLGWLFSGLLTLFIQVISFLPILFLSIFRVFLRLLLPIVIRSLQPLTKKGKAALFMDYMWRSLPMDNAADDILLGTEFTEIWIPLAQTEKAMQLLNDHFVQKGYPATGFYSTELYAGFKSKYWMSPAFEDETYPDGALRVDVFWYINNQDIPNTANGFFRQFWDLFRNNDIPFRLHWGKFIPDYDFKDWVDYYRSQLPKWDDFMKLRAERDPKNIFLTDYWRLRLFGED